MVDVREPTELPGLVRTILVVEDDSVTIEWDRATCYVAGDDEGRWGPKIYGEFSSRDALIASLEAYIGLPLEQWTNYTRTPLVPVHLDYPHWRASVEKIREMVRKRELPMPTGTTFKYPESFWRHVEIYGEYRRDIDIAEAEAEWAAEDAEYGPDSS